MTKLTEIKFINTEEKWFDVQNRWKIFHWNFMYFSVYNLRMLWYNSTIKQNMKRKDVEPMHSAIGSRKDFSNLDEDQLLAEYKACLEGILDHEQVMKLDLHTQHCNTSRLQHSINVSYYSFLICRMFGWDYRSAARAGLLHDLYFYDWRVTKYLRSGHASWHPRVALDNAKRITELNKVEIDAIEKHMWPCTPVPPRYIESYVITFVDKTCAVVEFAERKCAMIAERLTQKFRRSYAS